MNVTIEYICEQDGPIERNFKNKISQVFLRSGKNIRAYLVLAKYIQQNSHHVILCIKTNDTDNEKLLSQCTDVFKSMFAQDQQLDIIFIPDRDEKQIRKLCCPFYTSENDNVSQPDFFLFSNESYNLHDVIRNCYMRKRLHGSLTDGYILCDIDPPLIGQAFGLGARDINQFVIASRHEGVSLFPITQPLVYIFAMRPLIDGIEFKDVIEKSDVELIAWAEIAVNKNNIKQYDIGSS